LLRVLQDGEFTRVGGKQVIKTDVRVVAATNSDLEKAIEDGTFRKDLFYRLSVFPISLPPLRDRIEDIHLLVYHFLESYKEKSGRFVSGISKEAMRALVNYDWPGNIRELENAIERATIIASGRQIELDDLPAGVARSADEASAHARQERASAAANGRAIGIEIVVLVIAADEGVMPQTREHFDICRLLDIKSGLVALTKSDLVDDETRDLARLDIAELVAGSFLENAPVIAVSSKTGSGVDTL